MDNSRRIRVAMLARVVFPLHGFGGIERHVFHLTTHLARLGVDVTLYVQPPHTEPATATQERSIADVGSQGSVLRSAIHYTRYDYTSPYLRPNSILGRQLNYPWYSWEIGRQAAQAARRGAYDIVHAQGLCAFGYGWIRQHDRLLRSIPFIANPHGLEEYRTPDWRKRLAYAPFRALYTYGNQVADRVIATDACTKDDVPRYLHVDPAKVVVIPSAIDVEECLGYIRADLRMALRTRFALNTQALTLLSVGRLERNKGFHIMIAALQRLHHVLPERWIWLVVGQGKERAALERQIHEVGLAEHVQFAGRLDDAELHSLYEEADLIVHPTLYEGSSLVTLEAMIHKKPIIASAVGGIPDKVFDERNGYLVAPGDVADLAAKLTKALAARARWPEWGEASAQIVRTTFDWPVVAQRTRSEYERMLQRNPV